MKYQLTAQKDQIIKSIKEIPRITEIAFNNAIFSEEYEARTHCGIVHQVAEAAKSFKKLSLQKNNLNLMPYDELITLAQIFQKNSTIKVIDLSDNKFQISYGRHSERDIADFLFSFPHDIQVKLGGNFSAEQNFRIKQWMDSYEKNHEDGQKYQERFQGAVQREKIRMLELGIENSGVVTDHGVASHP